MAHRLFAHTFHAFRLQRDRQTEGETSQLGYILRLSPLQVVDAKKSTKVPLWTPKVTKGVKTAELNENKSILPPEDCI